MRSCTALRGNSVRLALPLLMSLFLFLSIQAAAGKPLKGVALVIGQSDYEQLSKLPNPERDAREIEDLLSKLGFESTLAIDQKKRQARRAVDGFIEDAEGADVALVYYSGHAIEAGGTNYLIPIDAGVTSLEAVEENFLSLQDVLDRLKRKARITILLLDACRSNPFPGNAVVKRTRGSAADPVKAAGLGVPKGVAVLENPETNISESVGEIIGYAAEPGQVALDGPSGANSPYAAALLRHFSANAGFDFGQVMTMVTQEVYLATGTRQRPWTNTSLRQVLVFGGEGASVSPDDARLDGERRQLLLTIAATPQEWRRTIESLAMEQALPLDPLYGMLRELQVDTSQGSEQIDKQLRAGAENLRKLLAEKVAPLRKDPELSRLAGIADRAQAQGAIALAKEYRAKASARADELDKTLDQREADATADRIELAATYAEEAETAVLAFDHRLAAAKYARAYEQVKGRESTLALKYLVSEASALSSHGKYKGDNAALKRAAQLQAAVVASFKREKAPLAWAKALNMLGDTLSTLGERDSDTQNLTRAIAIYKTVLTEQTRQRAPLDWAATQSSLAAVLVTLGVRLRDTQKLRDAVAAYEAALTEQTRERVPLDWATTQSNLGGALAYLGGLEKAGPENLVKAVAAYEAALTELTREDRPLNWASIQNNLGGALWFLSERGIDAQNNLTKAIAAHEAALTVWRRERMPLIWAKAQYSLGNDLLLLGIRESGTGNIAKAIAAYEVVLTERTRERVPLDWAATQNSLGTALARLGERESGTRNLVKAVAAYKAALSERTRERLPLEWATIQNNLGRVLKTIAGREKGTTSLYGAVAAFEAALTVHTRDRDPLFWAKIQADRGEMLRILGERTNNMEHLTQAVSASEAALSEQTPKRALLDWARTQETLGKAKLAIGRRTGEKSALTSGRRSIEILWELYKVAGQTSRVEDMRRLLLDFDDTLSKLGP